MPNDFFLAFPVLSGTARMASAFRFKVLLKFRFRLNLIFPCFKFSNDYAQQWPVTVNVILVVLTSAELLGYYPLAARIMISGFSDIF